VSERAGRRFEFTHAECVRAFNCAVALLCQSSSNTGLVQSIAGRSPLTLPCFALLGSSVHRLSRSNCCRNPISTAAHITNAAISMSYLLRAAPVWRAANTGDEMLQRD
jgi:hypothetical protein